MIERMPAPECLIDTFDNEKIINTHTDIIIAAGTTINPFEYQYKHMRISVDDVPTEDLRKHMPRAIHFIKEAHRSGGNLLVHCRMGRSRSAVIVEAYCMHEYGMTAAEAARFVEGKRQEVDPNLGFIRQLAEFEQDLCSNRLVVSLL